MNNWCQRPKGLSNSGEPATPAALSPPSATLAAVSGALVGVGLSARGEGLLWKEKLGMK